MLPLRDNIPASRFPAATVTIIILNVIVFLHELSLGPSLEEMLLGYSIIPARYTNREIALQFSLLDQITPFFTSMFLHGGWLHLLGNMWTLWIFGDNVEDRMGPVRFLFFYLFCGFIAGLVHWLTNLDSVVPTVGASGAIAGVLGAYLFLFPFARVIVLVPVFIFPFFFELPAVTYLGFWVIAQIFSGTLVLATGADVGGIAWWAHVGGFVAGISLQFFFVHRGASYRRLSRDEYEMENAWVPINYCRRYR